MKETLSIAWPRGVKAAGLTVNLFDKLIACRWFFVMAGRTCFVSIKDNKAN